MSYYLSKSLKIVLPLILVFSLVLVQSRIFYAQESQIISVVAYIDDGIADYPVVNKIYYDMDKEHGSGHKNEWVEIYNPTDGVIDISGWTIEDNNSSDVIPDSLPVPALGFAIITGEASTFDYWNIPAEAVKIILDDGKIGNGLHNDEDMLILRNKAGDIIDQMNWGVPDIEWPDYNEHVWNPGTIDVRKGKILGRVFNGFDTKKPSDFREFSLPEIGINLPKNGDWLAGEQVAINWFVGSPNGSNEEVLIDIDVIIDNNNNWIPDSFGDEKHTIIRNKENTGNIYWDVYPFNGSIWIKVATAGQEDPMLNNFQISRRINVEPVDSQQDIILEDESEDQVIEEELDSEEDSSTDARQEVFDDFVEDDNNDENISQDIEETEQSQEETEIKEDNENENYENQEIIDEQDKEGFTESEKEDNTKQTEEELTEQTSDEPEFIQEEVVDGGIVGQEELVEEQELIDKQDPVNKKEPADESNNSQDDADSDELDQLDEV